MRSRSWLAVLALGVVLGNACSPPPKQAAPTPPAAAVPPPAPAPPAPVSADALPPRQRVEGDGITLTEYVDGRVRVQTTLSWNAAFDTTYDNCDFYRGAIPVLERQLSPERGKRLAEMCAVPPQPGPGMKAAGRAKAAASAKAARPAKKPLPKSAPAP